MSAKLDKLYDRVDALKAEYNAAKTLQEQVLALRQLCDAYHRIPQFHLGHVADRYIEIAAALKSLATRIAELEEKNTHA